MTGALPLPYDPHERHTAARIQAHHPAWLILWGSGSRLYYALPLFDASPGTILRAPGPRELITAMRQTQIAATTAHRRPGPREQRHD